MYCSNCGKLLNEGDSFCSNCGSRVIKNVDAERVEEKAIEKVASSDEMPVSIVDEKSHHEEKREETQRERKRRAGKIVLAIFILIPTLIVVSLIISYFFHGKYFHVKGCKKLIFPIEDCFKWYGEELCAKPDEDYVSVVAGTIKYTNDWVKEAETQRDLYFNTLSDYAGFRNSGETTQSNVCGYPMRIYRCSFGDGGEVVLAFICVPEDKTIVSLCMIQDETPKTGTDYKKAFLYMLNNATLKSSEESDNSPTKQITSVNTNSISNSNTNQIESAKVGKSEIEKTTEALFSTYEEVYNEYTKKLKSNYSSWEKKMNEAVSSNKSVDYLAELYAEGLDELAEISTEGTEIMAEMANMKLAYGDYMEWATKLNSEYMTYGTNLYSIYMSSSLKSFGF